MWKGWYSVPLLPAFFQRFMDNPLMAEKETVLYNLTTVPYKAVQNILVEPLAKAALQGCSAIAFQVTYYRNGNKR